MAARGSPVCWMGAVALLPAALAAGAAASLIEPLGESPGRGPAGATICPEPEVVGSGGRNEPLGEVSDGEVGVAVIVCPESPGYTDATMVAPVVLPMPSIPGADIDCESVMGEAAVGSGMGAAWVIGPGWGPEGAEVIAPGELGNAGPGWEPEGGPSGAGATTVSE